MTDWPDIYESRPPECPICGSRETYHALIEGHDGIRCAIGCDKCSWESISPKVIKGVNAEVFLKEKDE